MLLRSLCVRSLLRTVTKQGIRPSTYFPDRIVGHAMFGEPFSKPLVNLIAPLIESVIPTLPAEGHKPKLHVNKTAVVMEG